MTVQELADYLGITPNRLSFYIEKKCGIIVPPIGNRTVDDYVLKKVDPVLYAKEQNQKKRAFTGQKEKGDKARQKKEKKKTRQINDVLTFCLVQGKYEKIVELLDKATDDDLIRYEEGLAEYMFQGKPIGSPFWEQLCKLTEIKWVLLRKFLCSLGKEKQYAKQQMKKNGQCLSRLLATYIEHCNSISEIANLVYSIKSTIKIPISNVADKVMPELRSTKDFDDIIDDMQLPWEQMIDFLIHCNSKIGLYVLGRNLLNQDVHKYYLWKHPHNAEIRRVADRILAECTAYPEIEYITTALYDACNSDVLNEASVYLEENQYKAFWDSFYAIRDKEIYFLKPGMAVETAHVVKVEQNYLIVRFGHISAKIEKKDLFYINVRDLRCYFNANDKISNLVIDTLHIENADSNRYRACRVTMKSGTDLEKTWQSFVSDKKGKLIKAKVLDVAEEGVFVSLGHGVEGLVYKSRMSMTELLDIQHAQDPYPELAVMIDDIDLEKRRCHVRACGNGLSDKAWNEIIKCYEVNHAYNGKVVSIQDNYLIVELAKGVNVKVNNSELIWKNCTYAAESLVENSDVKVLLLYIDNEKKHMTGSIKRLVPNPWEIAKATISTGEPCEVKVTDISDESLTVETTDSFRLVGRIKKNELSWYRQDRYELPLIGSTLTAKVVLFNPDKCKLALSVRQLEENPWNSLFVGKQMYGMVMNINEDRSADVRLENLLDARTVGFEQMLQVGEVYPFKITSFNQTLKEIVLSHQELLFDRLTEDIVKSFFNA